MGSVEAKRHRGAGRLGRQELEGGQQITRPTGRVAEQKMSPRACRDPPANRHPPAGRSGAGRGEDEAKVAPPAGH